MLKTALDKAQLNTLIKQQVITVLREFLGDPDFGLELTKYAKKKLARSVSSKKKGIFLEELKRKYL